jgi:hypothetical protein
MSGAWEKENIKIQSVVSIKCLLLLHDGKVKKSSVIHTIVIWGPSVDTKQMILLLMIFH